MSIALDFGAWRMRSLRRDNERLVGRHCRSVYAALPDTSAHRRVLKQLTTPYAVCEESLVLMGDAAAEYSPLFQVKCASLLPDGRVPQDDPPARQILASLVEALLPEPREPHEICCMTLPGIPGQRRKTDNREIEFLTRLLRLRGYEPLILSAGMAVVLSEMGSDSFTGIGVTFGAATTQLSLAHRGMEVARCSLPRGGDWIDEQLARSNDEFAWDAFGNRYLNTEAASRWKESCTGSILQPSNKREERLLGVCRECVTDVLQESARELSQSRMVRDLPQPLSVVCSGGTARIPGFGDLLEQTFRETRFPVEIEKLRVAADDDYTVARGCLISAELEAETCLRPVTAIA